MAADIVVARELKSLQNELSAAQRERLVAPTAPPTTSPNSVDSAKESPHERELRDQLGVRDIDRSAARKTPTRGSMIDHLFRDLQFLRKADFLIAKIWLNVLVRRLALFAFAGLIAVFGLGMANVAAFYAFQASLGAVWAATIVALVDQMVAAIVQLLASKSEPGPEIDLAFEVRKIAVETVQADAHDLRLMVDALGQELKNVKASITHVQNPLDFAAQKFLIPAALSIARDMMTFWGNTLKMGLVRQR